MITATYSSCLHIKRVQINFIAPLVPCLSACLQETTSGGGGNANSGKGKAKAAPESRLPPHMRLVTSDHASDEFASSGDPEVQQARLAFGIYKRVPAVHVTNDGSVGCLASYAHGDYQYELRTPDLNVGQAVTVCHDWHQKEWVVWLTFNDSGGDFNGVYGANVRWPKNHIIHIGITNGSPLINPFVANN